MTDPRGTAGMAAVAAVATVAAAGVLVREDGTPTAVPSLAAPAGTPAPSATPATTPSPSVTVSPAPAAVAAMPDTFVGVRGQRIVLFSTRTGEPLRYLTPAGSDDALPRFTADRSRIQFVRRPGDCRGNLMEMRPDGSGVRTLLSRETAGSIPSPGVETVRGTAYVDYECAEGYGTLVLRARDGKETRMTFANAMSLPAVSADGRYVYVQSSGDDELTHADAFRSLYLRRFDVTRRTRDLVVRSRAGCEWEGGVAPYVYRGRPSIVAGQRCGTGAAARSSLVVLDEALGGTTLLLELGADHLMSVDADPGRRHLLLYRSNWRDDAVPDSVQRWSGGRVETIARDTGDADW